MSTAAAVVKKEIPAKTKTYLAFGLWIMEKTMTEEEARNKMIEMFIGCETIDGICEKFEAFNEKEMVEKLVQIHKSLKPKPIKKKTEKKIESPDNIVNELVSLATNAVPAVPENENENVVPSKPTAEKKKRAAPKANVVPSKPTEDKAKVAPVVENVAPVVENVAPVVENVAPVVENVAPVVENVAPVVENVASSASDVKKKRVVKPKTESLENVVVTENVVIESIVPSVIESIVPSVVKAPKKKATPKAKPTEEKAASESVVPSVTEEKAASESVVPSVTEEKAVTESIVATVTEEKAVTEENVVPSAVDVVKAPKKKATPKAKPTEEKAKPTEEKAKPTEEKAKPTEAKATSENVVPSATEEKPIINEVVTSDVQASENAVPSNVVVPSTEDKKKKPKAEKPKTKAPVVPAVVESPKNDVGAPEEFEDTELVVKEFVYGTKSYYIDEEETIYEQEGLKKIGKLVNGKLVFDSV